MLGTSFEARYARFMKHDYDALLEQRGYLRQYAQTTVAKRDHKSSPSVDLLRALDKAIEDKKKAGATSTPRAPPMPPALPAPVERQKSEPKFRIEVHKCGGKGQVIHVAVPIGKRLRDEDDEFD